MRYVKQNIEQYVFVKVYSKISLIKNDSNLETAQASLRSDVTEYCTG